MTSVQNFSCILPTISEYSKETFSLEPAFGDVRNSGLQGCSVREKSTLSQRFFQEFSKFQNTLYFLTTLRMYLQCSPVVGYRLYSRNSNKRELHYIFFSLNLPKFSVQLFQNTLIKSSVMESSGLYTVVLFILKNDSARNNSLTFLQVKLSPLKNL